MTTTAAQAMVAATARLRAAGVDDPARDARVLLAHAARIEAARVTLIAPEELSHEVAERYDQLDYLDVLTRDLKVMDASAVTLMRENDIPIVVFNIHEQGGLAKVLAGDGVCTIIGKAPAVVETSD